MIGNLINLKDLLEKDESASPSALSQVFGDSYLVQHNRVYRNVRNAALDGGFGYVTDPSNDLWSDYQLMSLTCLDRIMAAKTIPCYPSKRAIRRLSDELGPDLTVPFQFLLMTLALNNHFHESAHALGYEVLSANPSLLCEFSESEGERKIWGSLLTEALANTIEYLAWIVSSTYTERLFLRLNAASSYEDQDLRTFSKYVASTFGMDFLFERVFFSFLLGRLYPDVTSAQKQLDLAGIFIQDKDTVGKSEIAAILLRTGKALRADFRDVVAPSYFAILGLSREYHNIISRNVLLSSFAMQLREFSGKCFELCWLRDAGTVPGNHPTPTSTQS